ncbi:hypothetical protein JD969_18900 [Planctomycetota bacterium]|nr:hypothetical protein JD969_18900 [Planctomycetota bacterium]
MNRPLLTMTIAASLTALSALTGCRGTAATTPEYRYELASIPYPKSAKAAPDVDIVAARQGENLRLVNRTPWEYTDIEVWINQQYVYRIDKIDIGSDNLIPLSEAINEFEIPFPLGTFLRPEKGFPVVLTELYDPKTQLKYRLNTPPVRDEPGIFW